MAMDFSIPDFLFNTRSLVVFFLVSIVMGGGAAWLSGRAIAMTWRPWWHVAFYMVVLAVAVRFIDSAVFDTAFLSLHYYLVDAAICLGFGFLGFREMRVYQMVTRYKWINQRSGLLGWRRRDHSTAGDQANRGIVTRILPGP